MRKKKIQIKALSNQYLYLDSTTLSVSIMNCLNLSKHLAQAKCFWIHKGKMIHMQYYPENSFN